METSSGDRTTARPHDRTTRYTRNSKTISGRLHDELVMMDLGQGEYFSLNPVATRIWDLLEKVMTVDDLCIILINEYDVEPERCISEVDGYLAEMVRLGLVMRIED
ncbi:MAG: PqqD family protein [Bacteroidales bacterium]|nr:PqqD family protein [Bacteroidales bacterium]